MFPLVLRKTAAPMSVNMHSFFFLIKNIEYILMRLGLRVFFQHQDLLSNGRNLIFYQKSGFPTNL